MARSNKPLVWLPFALGGTLAAFVLPAMMIVLLLGSMGVLPESSLPAERVRAFAGHPVGGLTLLILLGFPLWHAAHRLRMTLQDLGAWSTTARRVVAWSCYTGAGIASAILLYALWALA